MFLLKKRKDREEEAEEWLLEQSSPQTPELRFIYYAVNERKSPRESMVTAVSRKLL